MAKKLNTDSLFFKVPKLLMDRLEVQAERLSASKASIIRQGLVKFLEELEASQTGTR